VQKVRRNLRLLRGELTGKRESIVTPYAPQVYVFEDPLARIDFSRLITDEEMAEVEYRRLAEDPAVKQNELAHSTILGIAEDEKRHAQQLKDVLDLLVRERKIV